MFDLFKKPATSGNSRYLMQLGEQVAEALRRRFLDLDAEIEALKESHAQAHVEMAALKSRIKVLEHEIAVAQRKSLAQKLRDKGAVK